MRNRITDMTSVVTMTTVVAVCVSFLVGQVTLWSSATTSLEYAIDFGFL
jgi:hypothetical protein